MAPTWIETDTNTNVNISSATAVGVYTSTGDKFVLPQLLADQVAGNGDYVYYVTLQVNGAGSAYVIGPKTTHTAAAGETAIGAQGGFIAVRSGDVVTVYVDGLAGDTATPDVTVRWFELAAAPTASDNATAAAAAILVTPANKLATAAAGGVSLAPTQPGVEFVGTVKLNPTTGVGLEITSPDDNAIYVYSETEAVWLESGASAGLEILGKPYAIFLGASNLGGSAIRMVNNNTDAPVIDLQGGSVGLGDDRLENLLRPAVAGRTLAVDASGNASANVTEQSRNEIVNGVWNKDIADHAGPTTTGGRLDLAAQAGPVGGLLESVGYQRFRSSALENVRSILGLSAANLDTQLAAILANTNALAAIGIYSYSDTVTDPSDNPLDGVLVLLATDDAFGTIVSFARTNAAGQFTVRSDTPGTHYLRLQLAPYSFEDQTIELT